MIPYRELRKRIDRDKARKTKRREAREKKYDNIDNAATMRHYVRAIRMCRKGVRFKLSVQRYCMKPFGMILRDMEDMRAGRTPPMKPGKQVTIRERGKERIITPIQIRDRVNQRVLCDWALCPMIYPRLIYDNGASVKGKGVKFARDRVNRMIERAKRQWGSDFWVLTFDFKKFFDSIPHWLCREELEKTFRDRRIVEVTMGYVTGYGDTGRGVCLGSHVSQVMALCVPNFLDHWIKDVAREKLYIRSMDDGIVFGKDKAHLRKLMREIGRICREHGIEINEKKTRIRRARDGFTFLKVRYRVDGMKTVKRLDRQSVIRMRRKLKKFRQKVERGKMTPEMVRESYQSWTGHTRRVMAFRQRKRMQVLYREMFGGLQGQTWHPGKEAGNK